MNKNQAFSHPEIELRPVFSSKLRASNHQSTTILDLLEVYPDHVSWKERLDHSSLLNHFRAADIDELERPQPLRIFFVDEFDFVDPHRLKANPSLEHNTTAYWMRQRFGVSPLFFCSLSAIHVVTMANASLIHMEAGKRVALDGLYRFSSGFRTPATFVWFSHSLLKGQSSTYIIHSCPEQTKSLILSYGNQSNSHLLMRPLAIDAFLVEHALDVWGEEASSPRYLLIKYEMAPISQFNPSQTDEAVEKLHSLSQQLHIIREHLTDIQERLQYLVGVRRRLTDLLRHRYGSGDSGSGPVDRESIDDSFQYLLSKTSILKRWVVNYTERTGIRINLFFNIATQSDSRTNLEIARLSSNIAVSTQRDSSSMITISIVTMFFLPGTFVSALFSIFFDRNINENGNESIIISRQWLLFTAITIPFTFLVFAIWATWQRYRSQTQALNPEQVLK